MFINTLRNLFHRHQIVLVNTFYLLSPYTSFKQEPNPWNKNFLSLYQELKRYFLLLKKTFLYIENS